MRQHGTRSFWPPFSLTDGALAALVLVGLVLLYRSTTGANPIWDGVNYCFGIASGNPAGFLCTQHLAYGFTGYCLHRLLSLVAPLLPVWDVLLLVSAVSGALCVAVFYGGCRRLGVSSTAALPCALLLGTSIEFWRHAVNVQYIALNAFLVSLFFAASTAYVRSGNRRHALWLGVALGLAILAHLRHGLLVPAALTLVLSSQQRWTSLVRLVVAAALVAASGYAVAAWTVLGKVSPGGMLRWALSGWVHVSGKSAVWWVWDTTNLLWAPIRQLGAVVDVGHVRHLLWAPDRFNGVAPVLAAVILAVVVGGAGLSIIPFGTLAVRPRAVAAMVAWLVPYWIFFSFWCPSDESWWVVGLIPLWALVALGVDRATRTWRWAFRVGAGTVLVAVLSALNLSGPNGVLGAHLERDHQIAHLFRLHRDGRIGDIVLWLGYLSRRGYGSTEWDVCPGIQAAPQGHHQAGFFAPVRTFTTCDLVSGEDKVAVEALRTLQAGRTVWVSLAGCEQEPTAERARQLHVPSARAISCFLDRFELAPTGTECLWTLVPGQHVETGELESGP